MMQLKISKDLKLPLETVTSTLIVYGGKGMGKTNLLSVFSEEFYKANLRFSVIDPMGVCWGLQHGADKSKSGIDVLILGGIHGDIPIEPTAGAVVADLVVDETVSTVIDISRHANGKMWSRGERIRFVADYFTRLYERQGEQRNPIFQWIDEAARFLPQQIPHGAVDIARCVGAIEQVGEEGRNVGIGLGLLAQRSARLNKSVAELADCMFSFRTVGPNSIKAILEWFGEHVPKERWKELIEKIRTLPIGNALVVSPGWLQYEGVAQMRPRETFDSSATPRPGKALRAPGKATKPDLKKYRERMKETIERAQTADPRALRQQLAERDQRIKKLEGILVEANARAERIDKKLEKIKPVEKPVITTKQMRELKECAREMNKARAKITGIHEAWGDNLKLIGERINAFLNAVTDKIPVSELQKKMAFPVPSVSPKAPSVSPKPTTFKDIPFAGEAPTLTGPEQRILNAIAWIESLGQPDADQAAAASLAGYTVGGGAWNNPRGSLNTKGLVSYRPGNRIALTDAGRALAQVPDVPLTTAELHEKVMERLAGPERKILKVLIDTYPFPLSNEEASSRAGYAIGGAYNNPKGRLRSLGLIDYPEKNMVVAKSILFLD